MGLWTPFYFMSLPTKIFRDVPHCWTVGQSHPAQTPRIVRPSSKIHVWTWWLRTSQLETAWAPSVMLVVVGGHAMVWGDTVQSWYGFPVKLTLNHQNLRIWRFFCDFGPFSNPMIFVYIYYTDILIWIWISINHEWIGHSARCIPRCFHFGRWNFLLAKRYGLATSTLWFKCST